MPLLQAAVTSGKFDWVVSRIDQRDEGSAGSGGVAEHEQCRRSHRACRWAERCWRSAQQFAVGSALTRNAASPAVSRGLFSDTKLLIFLRAKSSLLNSPVISPQGQFARAAIPRQTARTPATRQRLRGLHHAGIWRDPAREMAAPRRKRTRVAYSVSRRDFLSECATARTRAGLCAQEQLRRIARFIDVGCAPLQVYFIEDQRGPAPPFGRSLSSAARSDALVSERGPPRPKCTARGPRARARQCTAHTLGFRPHPCPAQAGGSIRFKGRPSNGPVRRTSRVVARRSVTIAISIAHEFYSTN